MKTLVIIWAAVVVVALGTGAYVNAAINEMVQETAPSSELQPAATAQEIQPAGRIIIDTYNPQQTINGKELQGN